MAISSPRIRGFLRRRARGNADPLALAVFTEEPGCVIDSAIRGLFADEDSPLADAKPAYYWSFEDSKNGFPLGVIEDVLWLAWRLAEHAHKDAVAPIGYVLDRMIELRIPWGDRHETKVKALRALVEMGLVSDRFIRELLYEDYRLIALLPDVNLSDVSVPLNMSLGYLWFADEHGYKLYVVMYDGFLRMHYDIGFGRCADYLVASGKADLLNEVMDAAYARESGKGDRAMDYIADIFSVIEAATAAAIVLDGSGAPKEKYRKVFLGVRGQPFNRETFDFLIHSYLEDGDDDTIAALGKVNAWSVVWGCRNASWTLLAKYAYRRAQYVLFG